MAWDSYEPLKDDALNEAWKHNADTLRWAINKTRSEPDWVKRVAGRSLTVLRSDQVTDRTRSSHDWSR